MSGLTPPAAPPYRVTLFFGPEPLDEESRTLQCVFNVKKRSWKAGIQVAVQLSHALILMLRERCDFEGWLASVLTSIGDTARTEYRTRAEELLVIELARCKLEDALESGVPQENHELPVGVGENRLPELVGAQAATITARIGSELDLPAA